MSNKGKIVKIAGPLVVASGMESANMFDVVRVGRQRLIGEVIEMRGGNASIQVYEETAGIAPGDEVETTGAPLSVELAPGLITNIYDGIQRPLEAIRKVSGNLLHRGVEVTAVDHNKKWKFDPVAAVGDKVIAGDVLGTVQETEVLMHKIMVPPNMNGTVVELRTGDFKVTDITSYLFLKERGPFPSERWCRPVLPDLPQV